MKIVRGDITTLHVDAIVNAANGHVGVMGAGVAGAIRRAGGYEIERDAKALCSKKKHAEGSVYVTGAGILPARYVLHAVTMAHPGGRTSLETVEKCLRSIFTVAAALECESIAIPGLGTKIGRAPIDLVADIYRRLVPELEENTGVEAILCDIDDELIRFWEA